MDGQMAIISGLLWTPDMLSDINQSWFDFHTVSF